MSDFHNFKVAVSKQLDSMSKLGLYQADTTKDTIWEAYLGSFVEGTNPIYRERTEHDCVCCKQFIRAIGGAIAFEGVKVITAWDITLEEGSIYQPVADALAAYVRSCGVRSEFLHYEANVGTDKNNSLEEDGSVTVYEHFHYLLNAKYVMQSGIAEKISDSNSNFAVLYRSLQEINVDSAKTVLELIDQNSLYRGEEHRKIVQLFLEKKREFDKLEVQSEQKALVWQMSSKLKGASKIRNTVIGTLLSDISEGVELDKAVKSFEAKVAPANYKRPTTLVTPTMIKKAQAKCVELGIVDSLSRRYAQTDDITINNVIYADRSVKKVIDNVFDELLESVPEKVEKYDKVEEVPVKDFIEKVVPHANSIELFLENKHTSNLMSLVAPQNEDAKGMFKWGNNFSWAYNGDIADSDMRQRVQALGGRVDGVFRFTHSWNHEGDNQSLMDLHVFMPTTTGKKASHSGLKPNDTYPSTRRVGWNNRTDKLSQGNQDVDYTSEPCKDVPVENITFPSIDKMPEGVYTLKIHNWNSRRKPKSGFKAEVEFCGEVFEYDYPKPLAHKEWVTVAEVTLKNGVFTINHKIPTTTSEKGVWGVMTQKFHKVNMIMNSPNHWDGEETGNKHHFFILDECNNPEDARGFFNEYLSAELTPNRKVLEVLGGKMKAPHTENQLSGLGFSSTQRNEVLVKVVGNVDKVVKVIF